MTNHTFRPLHDGRTTIAAERWVIEEVAAAAASEGVSRRRLIAGVVTRAPALSATAALTRWAWHRRRRSGERAA